MYGAAPAPNADWPAGAADGSEVAVEDGDPCACRAGGCCVGGCCVGGCCVGDADEVGCALVLAPPPLPGVPRTAGQSCPVVVPCPVDVVGPAGSLFPAGGRLVACLAGAAGVYSAAVSAPASAAGPALVAAHVTGLVPVFVPAGILAAVPPGAGPPVSNIPLGRPMPAGFNGILAGGPPWPGVPAAIDQLVAPGLPDTGAGVMRTDTDAVTNAASSAPPSAAGSRVPTGCCRTTATVLPTAERIRSTTSAAANCADGSRGPHPLLPSCRSRRRAALRWADVSPGNR